MNFDDTPEEAEFRAQIRTWLEGNATPKSGPDDVFGMHMDETEVVAAARAWQATKFAAGYAAIAWPKNHGGAGGTSIQQVIFDQEAGRYLVPGVVFEVTFGTAIPTVNLYGSAQQRDRYVEAALKGDHIWCQLFSEPSAGSDTGNIRTRATRDGDDWVINGQKVWTSGAHYSDYGLLLARSDWDKPKSKGLTMFVLDMNAPGVEVRQIHQASGARHFCEVFLNDVRIPASQQLGEESQGWQVMLSTLMMERLSVGGVFAQDLYNRAAKLASKVLWDGKPAIEDSRLIARIADIYLNQFGIELIIRRGLSAISKGEAPGPEMSLTKLVGAQSLQQVGGLLMELGGAEALIGDEMLGNEWSRPRSLWLSGASARLAGGTDEILRNVISERVLGLPGEIRTDRNLPFRDLA